MKMQIFLIAALCAIAISAAAPDNKPETNPSEASSDETMDTADNIVFKPLFRYKNTRVEKKRVQPHQPSHVPAPAPAHQGGPPPVLVYDPKTKSYYPQYNTNYGYYSGH